MLVRALKSFFGRYGHIRIGQEFNAEPHYAEQLKANGLVEDVSSPQPSDNRAIPVAPQRAAVIKPTRGASVGKDGATGNTVRAPAGGKAGTSRSLRADLVSQKKTRKRSAAGAKKTDDPATP